MSSNPKVDLSNVRHLLKIYTEIKTNLSTVELKEGKTKSLHKIAPFLKMAGMYVPRSKELSNGPLNRASWKIDHLLTSQLLCRPSRIPRGKAAGLPATLPVPRELLPGLHRRLREYMLMTLLSMRGMTMSHHFRSSSTTR